MITETVSALTEPTKGVLEPLQKLNEQVVATVEKLAARQMDSLKAYSDLGVSQLRAVTEVRDLEGLQTFLSKQSGVLRTVAERLVADTKAVTQMGVDFVAEARSVSQKEAPASPAEAKAA